MIAILAIAIFVLALTLLSVVRSLQQIQNTGNIGWRFPQRHHDRTQWTARVLMGVGGLVSGIAAPAFDLAGLPTVPLLDHIWLRVTGLALAVAAAAAAFVAQQHMGASWRIGIDAEERTSLITSGAFAYVRNPIFTALITFIIGLALAIPNPLVYIALAAVITGIQIQVRQAEEPYLLRTHGRAYRDYSAGTGRFLPGIGKSR